MEKWGKEAGDEDVSSRGGLCLGGVGGELRRVGVVEGVLLDGQGEGKSRNGEEQTEAHHTGSSPQDFLGFVANLVNHISQLSISDFSKPFLHFLILICLVQESPFHKRISDNKNLKGNYTQAAHKRELLALLDTGLHTFGKPPRPVS